MKHISSTAQPPTQPTAADNSLLAVAQTTELAVRDLYLKAIDSGLVNSDESAMLQSFADHHTAYAQSLNGLLSKSAPNKRDEAMYLRFAPLMTTAQSIRRVLQSLENTLVANHTSMLANLEGLDGATLIASIITVEARHAAIFGMVPSANLSNALNSDVAVSI